MAMEFTAKAKFMRGSPQKARLVLDMIKGRRVEDALNILEFTNKRFAPTIHKLLRSALENANYLNNEKGMDVDIDRLYVKQAVANEGPRMKRIRPAPMGRAYRYQRRMAHIAITLGEKAGQNGAARAAAPDVEAAAKPKKSGAKHKAGAKKKTPAKKFAGKK
jgi:large subunit ribosomal protein L22